jgi:chemotaxis protein methyltransferase CheR
MPESVENENLEVRLLLEAIFQKYGYDFRQYTKASIKRRILQRVERGGFDSITQLQRAVIYDRKAFEALLLDLTINVTEMFRDPPFFQALREEVLPSLAREEFVKIWHAGCATGEEIYSMAILLKEAGLYDKARIYATDLDEAVLAKARAGIFPADRIKEYTANYQRAGGGESFGDYYTARYDGAIMDKSLRKNIVFADHNLATDGVFAEVDMVVCRNVLIYFGRELQERAVGLFTDSLRQGGFLCIGSKESLRLLACGERFEPLVEEQKIYRKRPVPA